MCGSRRNGRRGTIENARHITGAELPERFPELLESKNIAVICGSEYRSSVAASLLQSKGYEMVARIIGGMGAWKKADFPQQK
jgi:hydroxyacylglutathione hydrolase